MMKDSVTGSGTPQNRIEENTAIFALTRKGSELAAKIAAQISGSACFCNRRYALPGMRLFGNLSDVFPSAWRECDSIICIMGCGIAVRMVSPLLENKKADPAVVVVDQDGQFAISLVSGHIGGANDLARKVASITGGQAVITTASDLQGKPAIDLAVKKSGLLIENSGMLSRIQAGILDEEAIWIFDPEAILLNHLPADHGFEEMATRDCAGAIREGAGIWVSELLVPPGLTCLRLRPLNLVVGIGCNRGTGSGEIAGFVHKILSANGLSHLSIRNFASIDIKANEQGLWDVAKLFERPIEFCALKEIEGTFVPNPSETVARHVGVKSVCEASALWSAGTRELMVTKCKTANCTLAIARVSSP